MKKGFKTLVLLLLVCALTASLCACGGSNEDVSGNAVDSSVEQPNGDSSAENAASTESGDNGSGDPAESGSAETDEPTDGGEITVGIAQDLEDSLDPHLTTAAGTREVLFNIFEGLVKPDSDGNIIPAVAEGYEISDDGTQYTFTLRDGITFHNGELVTVDDVVFSITRCAGKLDDSAYTAASTLSNIVSVEATDDKTVVITISEGNIEFLASLATTNAAIIPADYADQKTQPIGTGPFRYVSRAPQENFVMERYDGYWGEGAHLDRVTYKIITDADSLVLSLKSGAIDVCAHLTPDQVETVKDSFDIYEDTMKLVQALYLNNAVEPFDDVRVRQALCYAVNVDEIIDFVCSGYGVRVGSSMFPAFGKYFDESLSNYYEYDPEKAKSLLAEAGYPDGFEMTITAPSNYQQHMDAAQVIVEQLKAVGITATIIPVEWETWVSDVYGGRDFQSTVVGFDASTMTARAMLERWTSDHGKNMINFNDAEYDEVFAQAAACTDDEEQTALYHRLLEILAEQAANVYIEDLCDMVAVNPALGGFTFYPIYVLDLSTVYYK